VGRPQGFGELQSFGIVGDDLEQSSKENRKYTRSTIRKDSRPGEQDRDNNERANEKKSNQITETMYLKWDDAFAITWLWFLVIYTKRS